MRNEEFVKKVYLSSVEGTNRRGRLLGRWKNRVKKYVSERGVIENGLEWARRECIFLFTATGVTKAHNIKRGKKAC